MTRTLSLLTVAALLGGCASNNGVWFFRLGEAEISGTSTCSENLTTGSCPASSDGGGDDEWTYTSTGDSSESAFFGQIFSVAGEEKKLLQIDDAVYTGVKQDGLWIFSWEYFDRGSEGYTHNASGFSYEMTTDSTAWVELELDISGGTATGTWRATSSIDETHTETDTWDTEELSEYTTALPYDELEEAEYNYGNNEDCEQSTCRISIVSESVSTAPVTAQATDLDADEYESVWDAGQPGGI